MAEKRIDWAHWKEFFGKLSDAEIAKQAGCSPVTVGAMRRKMGVMLAKSAPKLSIDWSKYDARLGKERDTWIAREIGCSIETVRARRVSLGINPYTPNVTYKCLVCGKEFLASPFSKRDKKLCSHECAHVYLCGRSQDWTTEKAQKEKLRRKERGMPKYVLDAGRVAAKINPKLGSFETNFQAFTWILADPHGKKYKFRNLNLWCRRNYWRFDLPKDRWANAQTSFVKIKATMEGRSLKCPVLTYKNWTVSEWIYDDMYTKKKKTNER